MNKNRQILSVFFGVILLSGSVPLSFAESGIIHDYISPKKQLESGVLPEEIQCRDNRVLVIRDNGSPACVRDSTAAKMGLEIIPQLSIKNTPISDNTNSDEKDAPIEIFHVSSQNSDRQVLLIRGHLPQ